jgi:tetratricopeptide (TPR) repeat protein
MALFLTSACPAAASARGGDRNFERAWRVFSNSQTDKAVEYFKKAAQEYAQALQEDPPSRTMRFPSTLIKAGISFYYAGDYDQCVKTMKLAVRKDERIWEADIYTALSQARQGDADAALKSLGLFLDSMSSQRFITNEVVSQMPGMKDGSVPLANGMELIEQSVQRQIVDNVVKTKNRRAGPIPKEQCSGPYWWRMSASPCSTASSSYD